MSVAVSARHGFPLASGAAREEHQNVLVDYQPGRADSSVVSTMPLMEPSSGTLSANQSTCVRLRGRCARYMAADTAPAPAATSKPTGW